MVIYNDHNATKGGKTMTWQEKVKELMANQKLNQKQLSQKSGITEASVSRYLKGDRKARMDIIINFAKALGVTTEYLLEEDNDLKLNSYTEIATAIARNGKNLSPEEKNRLIALILGREDS